MKSLVLIIPIDLKDKANELGEKLGYGPNNYSVPLSNSTEPTEESTTKIVTHYGLHAWADQSFVDMLEIGTMPEGLDFPPADFDAIMAALIVSARDDMTNHFTDVLNINGLEIIEIDDTP
jgi:hypothetical protein